MKFFAPFRISENISKTPEGYLLCRNVAIGRTGEMEYGVGETPIPPGPDGKVFVSRNAEQLFHADTIASFEGKALTILHPQDFVSPQNWHQLTKGVVFNVRRGTGAQESDLVADFLITVADAITLVEEGLREVSCGYEAEYIQTGVGRGYQTGIVGNHVALVEEGRAGASYAINDHKGKGSMKTVSEKIKAIFSKAQDEAMAAASEDVGAPPVTKTDKGLVTMTDEQFSAMMDAIGGKKEEKPAADVGSPQVPATGKPAEVEAKDEEVPPGIAALLAKIEERLAKLEARESAEEEVPVGDEDGDEDEEVADQDEEEVSSETGDSASPGDDDEEEDLDEAARAEILAPGMKASGKGFKGRALLAAYATADGKAAIHKFTGGKKPNTADEASCNAMFVGVSEVLKLSRKSSVASQLQSVRDNHLKTQSTPKGGRSADDINAINAKHYAAK
jgi:uncharacterized protein